MQHGKSYTKKQISHLHENEIVIHQSVKRKTLRQSGQAYISAVGTSRPAKNVKVCGRDHTSCRYECNFSDGERRRIHDEQWTLTDDQKRQFYINTTDVNKMLSYRRETALQGVL